MTIETSILNGNGNVGLTEKTSRSADFLKVQGSNITLHGQPIILKGACLGGWMCMENFMTGYPAQEHQMRAALLKVLGPQKYDYFFDKFLEYFFTESDVQYYKSLGFNVLRVGFNYHHFEDDMNPRVFKAEGLKHLDRVVNLCAKYGIYSILDFHALPGGQNTDWHSDNPTDKALFWVHKDFQDRAVIIWEHLAEHFKHNTWVAGYNVWNEPVEESGEILVKMMDRFTNAIRAIDPNHILFWDGNGFGSDFRQFREPIPNSVYACHDYSRQVTLLPTTRSITTDPYGTEQDLAKLAKSIHWKTEYQRSINGPIWNGEFGVGYLSEDEPNHIEVNDQRYSLLMEQIKLYSTYPNLSWTIWSWKDVGSCGVVYADPDSPYMLLVKDFLKKKQLAAVDSFNVDSTHLDYLFKPMWEWLCDVAPSMRTRYPKIFGGTRGKHLWRPVRMCLLAEELVPEYASLFEGKSFEELDALAKSFHFDNCVKRERLVDMLRNFASKQS
uniref:Glycoside hydrolase family 5 domain-containing protein n=1 Tax=Kwoniella bestiolae CBS 10118 TaxID=1296100 RepID=A0A1B9GFV8_9TREE|nr:hypothetical protein I302_01410 [Kwoniella bestiolae CBS 10118]OCF29897.1 hypothetical protein I302_01410 [Kwoniella bestiolae CBS 10118]